MEQMIKSKLPSFSEMKSQHARYSQSRLFYCMEHCDGASWGLSAIDRALASHHESRGSNLVGANKCPCTSLLNYMP